MREKNSLCDSEIFYCETALLPQLDITRQVKIGYKQTKEYALATEPDLEKKNYK